MPQIISLILAIPSLIKAVSGLVQDLERAFGPNWAEITRQRIEAFKDLANAKTSEDKANASKKLADSLRAITGV